MKRKSLFTIAPAILLVTTLASCGKKGVTIKFNTHDGTAIADVKFDNNGGLVARPKVIPTKEKYHFVDWVTDEEDFVFFNFNKEVKADTTIHAKYYTSENEVTKAEWEYAFNQFKFDDKTSFTLTIKGNSGEDVIKKAGNKITYSVGKTPIPFYIDSNGNLWSEEQIDGTDEYRYTLEETCTKLYSLKNSLLDGASCYDKAYFDGENTYVFPLNSEKLVSVTFKDVELSNGQKVKSISSIAGNDITSFSLEKPTLEDVFHTIKTDNRYTNFNYADDTWSIDKQYEKINQGAKQYFVINVDKDVKYINNLKITVDGKTPTEEDFGVKFYSNNTFLGNGAEYDVFSFTNEEIYKGCYFAIEINALKELKNINITLKTKDVINSTPLNSIDDEEAYIKYLDDSTLYAIGLAKVSKNEQDAIARQPEAAGTIHNTAEFVRNAIINHKVSGLQSYAMGKCGAAACDAVARQPEAAGSIKGAMVIAVSQIACNDKEVAIGFGGVASSMMDAIARQPEDSDSIEYVYTTIFAPNISICGSFDKALALGALGGNTMDSIARQPEAKAIIGYTARSTVEKVMNY